MALHEYTKDHLVALLDGATNKTLGQVDVNKVFDRTITNPKITGIAGDVIERLCSVILATVSQNLT